jgi:hypothetical protein
MLKPNSYPTDMITRLSESWKEKKMSPTALHLTRRTSIGLSTSSPRAEPLCLGAD